MPVRSSVCEAERPRPYAPAPSAEFELPEVARRGWYEPVKAAMDFVLALLLLVLTGPVLLLAALVVKLTSWGPAVYRQTRTGQNGRPDTIFKIRTMVHNCEARSGPRWATQNDPRVTRVGAFLRTTHLDEL